MKLAHWILLLLVLVIAALFITRPRHDQVAAPASLPVAIATPTAETAPGPVAASTETPVPVPAAVPAAELQPAEASPAGHVLQVLVQNAQGTPLEGAAVRASIRAARGSAPLTNFNRTATTSARGVADVVWPAQPFEQLELLVSKDEYESRRMVWDLKTGDAIPPAWTVVLKSGVHVGGFVVDPEGRPVGEATVSLSRFWRGGEERLGKGEEATFPSQTHVTGADGRWAARNLPAELLHRIYVAARHTNFVGVQVSMEDKPEVEQELRAGTHRLQLKAGAEVHGRVVNEAQEPIAGARVWAGRKYTRDRQETRSDAQGRFHFRNLNPGKVDFSASAEGYAPAAKSHSIGSAAEELVLQLAWGSVIRGTVQDEAGEPIPGVRVALEGSPGEESYDRFEFSTTTDDAGRFAWTSAPNEPMPFYFGKSGYEQRRGVRLRPGEDHVVTLRRNRQVHGQVLDAETEQPVSRFTVAAGRLRLLGKDQFYADAGGKEFNSEEGRFSLDLNEERSNGLQVIASGYAEQTQELPPAEDGQVRVVVKLKPSAALTGTVVTADGQPVPDATVALVDNLPGGRSVEFARGQLRSSGRRTRLVRTDASGRFEIPSPPETGTIVAANGAGYGSAAVGEVRASGVLVLQAFGRIEGMLLQGAGAGAGQELLLAFPNSGVHFHFESTRQTTDANGRFTFDQVPAGAVSIVRLVRTSSRSWQHSHRTEVNVTPGQTTPVVLGGTDATVFGQVRFETPPAEADLTINAQLSTLLDRPPPELSPEERQAFYDSPARKEQIKNSKHYAATVGADGTLMLDAIVPGEYTLTVVAVKRDDEFVGRKPLARGETKVTIPPGAQPGTPISVGEVVLKPAR